MKIITAFIALLWLSTAQASTLIDSETKAIEQAVNGIWQQQATDWSKGDIEAYMEAYWKSDKLRFAFNNTIDYGWQTTLDGYRKAYKDKAAMGSLTFTPIEIQVFDDSNAIIFGRYRVDRLKNGEPDVLEGLVTTQFRKIGGQWLIVSDHTS
ncbi:YybH family protein [Parendozoicomonas haliclonae]|uniref:DUF4440 domain-containing protein n=1 Tax=Parendozoicomonas haliclonae TaxID=1960125 RepID=A0A1X7AIS7_9GAMM|nr:nuclear transport factor 2 family protein [Parendozoicomonas haliclonae]SMA44273.1 hypothetical protein EHSB41UT_01767 [Parendozoicomonas haliclonae]